MHSNFTDGALPCPPEGTYYRWLARQIHDLARTTLENSVEE
jgi:hypothetical protein